MRAIPGKAEGLQKEVVGQTERTDAARLPALPLLQRNGWAFGVVPLKEHPRKQSFAGLGKIRANTLGLRTPEVKL